MEKYTLYRVREHDIFDGKLIAVRKKGHTLVCLSEGEWFAHVTDFRGFERVMQKHLLKPVGRVTVREKAPHWLKGLKGLRKQPATNYPKGGPVATEQGPELVGRDLLEELKRKFGK